MMVNKGLFTSTTDEWATPQEFFDAWNEKFHFTLDACANKKNHKCKQYFSPEQNGLKQSWEGETVWCNPPYGRVIEQWVKKCYLEAQTPGTTVVALLPARTDTRWFHDYIYHKAVIHFVKGRLKFGGSKVNAPFPSMVCIFRRSGRCLTINMPQ